MSSLILPERDPTPPDLGGRACLAIVNCEVWRLLDGFDMLGDVADAGRLLRRMRHVDDEGMQALAADAARDPAPARAALARLKELSFPLHAVFWSLQESRRPQPADLAAVDRHAAEALGHVRLNDDGERFTLGYAADLHPFDAVRLLAARSALDVLGSPSDVAHLKRCGGERCSFLFVDDSRNQTRRWCDTKLCGNRSRVKAHYRRRRGQATA